MSDLDPGLATNLGEELPPEPPRATAPWGKQTPGPKRWLRREWRLLVGLVLSALCLYLAIRGLSPAAMRHALAAAKWVWVLLAVVVVMAGTLLKAKRWQALFFPQRIRLGRAWCVFVIGQMLNVVLPGRAGEISRVYFIGEVEEVSRARALATVLAEKMVDLVMLALAYLAVAVWLTATPTGLPEWLRSAGTVVVPIASLSLAGLLLLAYGGRPAWRLLQRSRLANRVRVSLPGLPAADRAVEQAISGFEALRHWQTSAQVWTLSLMIWVLAILTNVVMFHAFQLALLPIAALLLLVVLMSGVAVPPLPGNLGVLPLLCQLVLSLFGVSRETALVYGLVLQIVVNGPLIVLGSVCLVWENWSVRQARLVAARDKGP